MVKHEAGGERRSHLIPELSLAQVRAVLDQLEQDWPVVWCSAYESGKVSLTAVLEGIQLGAGIRLERDATTFRDNLSVRCQAFAAGEIQSVIATTQLRVEMRTFRSQVLKYLQWLTEMKELLQTRLRHQFALGEINDIPFGAQLASDQIDLAKEVLYRLGERLNQAINQLGQNSGESDNSGTL